VELKSIEMRKTKMPLIRFALIVIQLQMRLSEVIGSRKSILHKEFGNCVELKSIEVRKTKMPPIRFALIVIQLQMRLIEVIGSRKSILNQEFQYHAESSRKANSKDYESIYAQQYQSANHPK
jgi:hypothetical protein